jgi:hypothetical protein
MEVPPEAKYTAMEGTCAAMVTMQVEAFEMGVLPSTPKNMSAEANPPPVADASDLCTACGLAAPCFVAEACILRDPLTGEWSGPLAPCNGGAGECEACFPDSPCLFDPTLAAAAGNTEADADIIDVEEEEGTSDGEDTIDGDNSSSSGRRMVLLVPTTTIVMLGSILGLGTVW